MDDSFHATVTPGQWGDWAGRNVAVQDDGLTLETEPTIDYHDLGFDAVDVAIDRDGAVYALRPGGDVYRYDRAGRATNVWTNGVGDTVDDPRSLCLAGSRLFVADGAGIVVVSERESRAVGRIEADVDDVVSLVTGDRTLYILDAGPAGGDGRVATLQRRGTVQTAIRGLSAPRDIAVDPEGNVSVLEMTDDGPVISVYEARYVASPDAFPYRRTIESFDVSAEGGALIPRSIQALSDEELIVHGPLSTSGEPATYHYRFADDTFARRHGLDVLCSRLRSGPQHGDVRYPTYYGVGDEEGSVYVVQETKKYRRDPETDSFTGVAFRRFDAGAVDTQWHRIRLGFDGLGPNTQVLVSYRAANRGSSIGDVEALAAINEHDAADLREAGIDSLWALAEADPQRIAEVAGGATDERAADWIDAAVAALADRSEEWTRVSEANPADALLDDATGRYLQVRLELVGDADSSPAVSSFRAYCPRQTYLRYLPDLYRDDRRGELFLEQFLSVFESAFTDIEREIDALSRHFDPAGVPSEDLSWLDQWLGVQTREDWPESARREFLDRAPSLYKRRGTRGGLLAHIDLYLDHVLAPDTGWILDWQRRRIDDRHAAGHLTDEAAEARHAEVDALDRPDAGGHHLFALERLDLDGIETEAAREPYVQHMPGPRSFAVFVGPFMDPEHRDVVETIVAEEKPAHTDGHVVPMRQHVKLEGNSFLGVNTTLTPRNFALGRATLGEDSVLREQDLL